jgi:hypothetical protein
MQQTTLPGLAWSLHSHQISDNKKPASQLRIRVLDKNTFLASVFVKVKAVMDDV